MAQITIVTTKEEQEKVLAALTSLKGKTVPVATIASTAGISQSRCRYVLTDLIDAGKISKVATKSFNAHYRRYMYNVL